MKRLEKALTIIHNGVTKKKYDCVGIISADEGTGKSMLGLHINEMWHMMIRGSIELNDIDAIALDRLQLANRFKSMKNYDLIIYDEAGDISSRRTMSNFNVMIQQLYMVVRGKFLFSILIVPSVFDLDSNFAKRRARFLIHIHKRGRFKYWSRQRLRRIIAYNQNRIVKDVNVVPETFIDTFADYKGVLLEAYNKKKETKMNDITRELYDSIATAGGGQVSAETEAAILSKHGIKPKEISEKIGKGVRAVQKYLKKNRENTKQHSNFDDDVTNEE